ncbi:glycosyltransferase family 2 protein [Peribacillus deserti]|uniref:Glycosyltransferase 2-like domain-containing protein n=1 Tax=Peribacillus deserti TaxID=673318 RepID=A0A2N5M0B8_9BACI|nr:glycosyltransferase [Peribacillus deserti]PLT27798.1 hypothetical protein CUU66_22055 [Peribacillus deserti]
MNTEKNVSIIIPSYNRGEILKNTLLSLKRQTYQDSLIQIILINDGSRDNTRQLVNEMGIPNLEYLENSHNKGAGIARNLGLQVAEGDIIIFCDSDFIVPETYVSNHVKEHMNNDKIVVSGMGHWHYILTYDFADAWLPFQKNDLQPMYNDPFIKERMLKGPNLINEEDIHQGDFSKFVCIPRWLKSWVNMFEEIISEYGENLKNFELPWLTFCTGNLSVNRDYLKSFGGFDTNFKRHEDWELGYRLYKDECAFKFAVDAEAYQQLAPQNPKVTQTQKTTYKLLSTKHPNIDILLLSLVLKAGYSFKKISDVLRQHKEVSDFHKTLTNNFEGMLRTYINEIPYENKVKKGKNRKNLRKIRHRFPEWYNSYTALHKREI